MKLKFQWNKKKAKINLQKHGVSFEEAASIFEDPYASTIFDPLHSVEEDRFVQIGLSDKMKMLVVVFTDREEIIRIISARKATKQEERKYEEKNS